MKASLDGRLGGRVDESVCTSVRGAPCLVPHARHRTIETWKAGCQSSVVSRQSSAVSRQSSAVSRQSSVLDTRCATHMARCSTHVFCISCVVSGLVSRGSFNATPGKRTSTRGQRRRRKRVRENDAGNAKANGVWHHPRRSRILESAVLVSSNRVARASCIVLKSPARRRSARGREVACLGCGAIGCALRGVGNSRCGLKDVDREK